MFTKDDRTAEQKQQGEQIANGILALTLFLVVLVCSFYLIPAFILGYLGYWGWKEKRYLGVAPLLVCVGSFILYLVGPPWEFMGLKPLFWSGALEEDFFQSLYLSYEEFRRALHKTPRKEDFFRLYQLIKIAIYTLPLGAVATIGILHKFYDEKGDKNYQGLKSVFAGMLSAVLYFPKRFSTVATERAAYLGIGLISIGTVSWIALLFYPAYAWAFHLEVFFLGTLGVLGLFELLWLAPVRERVEPGTIKISADGTSLGLDLLNYHVHLLGESGYGKSVLISHVNHHHIDQGLGLIFIDLKADTDTVSEIVSLCEQSGRLSDLRLFHCGRPEISVPYNVLIRGNATEIKDKLIGAFTWENQYYKDMAQSFLLTILKAMVYLRDHKGLSFSLKQVYECTLDSKYITQLQMALTEASAPEVLRDAVNEKAGYFRSKENLKELNGLRTQIQLLIESEFGDLLTSDSAGIDLFECIQSQKIVYILLDSQRYGESAKKLGKLILQDLKAASAQVLNDIPKEKRKHCSIIVDEFADLATEQFVGLLNRARASKIGILVAHQEMSDLDAFSSSMRDQVMGNTATTISFLQKMPESADTLSKIAGTKTTIKRTKQLAEEDLLIFKTKKYTGVESEREVEEYVIHPNVIKRLGIGECVIIGKYPSDWSKKVKILPPQKIQSTPGQAEALLRKIKNDQERQKLSHPMLNLQEMAQPSLGLTREENHLKGLQPETQGGASDSRSIHDPNF